MAYELYHAADLILSDSIQEEVKAYQLEIAVGGSDYLNLGAL